MRRKDWFGATQMILTSASSKTALGLASVARQRSPAMKRIGLTSRGNVAFVEASGLYDRVIAYDAIGDLASDSAVLVDFAGNTVLLGEIHAHLGEALRYSCLVGATHIDAERGTGEPVAGPQPVLFFAPDHAVALFDELGAEEAGRQMAISWRAFLADTAGSITIERVVGLDAAREVFTAMVAGTFDPAKGIVVEL